MAHEYKKLGIAELTVDTIKGTNGNAIEHTEQITVTVDAGDLALYPKGGIKHHDHLTTREYAYQLRTETTRTTTIFRGMDCEVHTGASVTAGGIHGFSMAMRVAAAHTVSGTVGSIAAIVGILDIDGTANSGTTVFTAGNFKVNDGGTITAVNHLCSMWLDSTQEDASFTGNHELLFMTNNGASVMDQAIFIYGGNSITNLFELNTVSGMVGANNGSGNDVYIGITVDGVAARIAAKYVS